MSVAENSNIARISNPICSIVPSAKPHCAGCSLEWFEEIDCGVSMLPQFRDDFFTNLVFQSLGAAKNIYPTIFLRDSTKHDTYWDIIYMLLHVRTALQYQETLHFPQQHLKHNTSYIVYLLTKTVHNNYDSKLQLLSLWLFEQESRNNNLVFPILNNTAVLIVFFTELFEVRRMRCWRNNFFAVSWWELPV